ncbi:DUF1415 domain-containing protein [Pseudocolwellia sp. AS88]|uniref:DUF1415 domain-containing protein n=1 Tax=Pseudocolwellia sp. AS88 TaxID=3063958 RepID=UPI0026EEDE6C|nr:DUF1415 domain-containing protein [Pseudocolwellia sp. AS88]MDO7085803.1 DUF1415 domain-containing protein [Pseudocolwellia sp. AS88]
MTTEITSTTELTEVRQTRQWIEQIIVELNFCPFAKKELVNNTIHYYLSEQKKLKLALAEVFEQCLYLKNNPQIETSLIIYNPGFKSFEQYLELVDYANELLFDSEFEGVFQLASFHPDYYFDGADMDDAENYTNRSPYPVIHLLREASLTRVLSTYKNPENIPENNIALAQEKGSNHFEQVLKNIRNS